MIEKQWQICKVNVELECYRHRFTFEHVCHMFMPMLWLCPYNRFFFLLLLLLLCSFHSNMGDIITVQFLFPWTGFAYIIITNTIYLHINGFDKMAYWNVYYTHMVFTAWIDMEWKIGSNALLHIKRLIFSMPFKFKSTAHLKIQIFCFCICTIFAAIDRWAWLLSVSGNDISKIEQTYNLTRVEKQ